MPASAPHGLLVFAGPLGWLALLFVATSRSGGAEVLSVMLPWSVAAYDRQRAATRRRRVAGWGAIGAAVVLLLGVASGELDQLPTPVESLVVAGLVAVGGWALIIFAVAAATVRRESVTVRLDASRRWVTVGGMHPDFAAAVRAREARQDAHR